MYIPNFLLPLAASAGLISEKRQATVCNGHAELCGRSYGNVTFLGAHDSYAFSTDPLLVSRDQEVDIPTQLGLGVRLLQAQAHMWLGELHFCHTSCLLFDGGTVTDYLKTVKTWLNSNPNEVLTFIFTNPESLSVLDVWKPAFDAANFTDLIYVPSNVPVKSSDWPTLGELIAGGKRVITFMDYDSNTTQVDFILPEFEMVWETPFSRTDPTFPCQVNRTSGPLDTDDHMYMINHSFNVDIFGAIVPDINQASTTNSLTSIMAEANGCAPLAGGKWPSFVLLDWVDIGDGLGAVDQLNGLPQPSATSSTATAIPSSSSASDSSANAAMGMNIRIPTLRATMTTTIIAMTFLDHAFNAL